MDVTLGKRIAQNRKRLGMTQDKLAEQLGVTAQAVSKWENDQACPDITMLPKLAAIFGISTDTLLGLKAEPETPVYEAEPVEDEDDFRGVRVDHDDRKFEMHWDGGRRNGLGLAVWILLTGGLLLASNILQWNAGLWEILWPTGLMVFGLWGLYPRLSFFRLGCALFGAYSLLDHLNAAPFQLGKELILPVLLLLFGLSLLADALKKPHGPSFSVKHNGKPVYIHQDGKGKFQSYCHAEGSHFSCSTTFGEDRRLIQLPKLSSGEAKVSFGELTVDLTGCESIADNCRIQASCSFGELKLLVPASCRVEPLTGTAFASVEFKGSPAADARQTIVLEGSASFGEIQIRYI